MAKQIPTPRKQRTRQHVIADQSVNYVQRFIIDEGHTAQELDRDYGYDLLMFTYDKQGYVEPDFVAIQIKAADTLHFVDANYVYDLDIRDYNLWMSEEMPVILILFDASRRRAFWLDIHSYFLDDADRRPQKQAKSVRVRVPMGQAINRRAISKMRQLKPAARLKLMGDIHDED